MTLWHVHRPHFFKLELQQGAGGHLPLASASWKAFLPWSHQQLSCAPASCQLHWFWFLFFLHSLKKPPLLACFLGLCSSPSHSLLSESTQPRWLASAFPRASQVLENCNILSARGRVFHLCFCCADLWVCLEYDIELCKWIQASVFPAQGNLRFPVGLQACRRSSREVFDQKWCQHGAVTFPTRRINPDQLNIALAL